MKQRLKQIIRRKNPFLYEIKGYLSSLKFNGINKFTFLCMP
jgi:hypothetical protein